MGLDDLKELGAWSWWITSIVGAFIGYALPTILKVPSYIYGKLKPHFLQGRWYHYFYQYQNGIATFKSELWDVDKGFFNDLTVKVKPQIVGEPEYSGTIDFEKNFFLTRMKSVVKGYEEEVSHRFKMPIKSGDMRMVGVSTAQDYEGNAAAGGNVLSSRPLTEAEAKELITHRIQVYGAQRVMHVVSLDG